MTGMYIALGVAAVILFLGLMALGLCRSAALADKQAGEHMRKLMSLNQSQREEGEVKHEI